MPKNNAPERKRPTHVIWQVIGEGDKARWIRIGAVFPHDDGKGFTPLYDVFPVAGRTVMRVVKPKPVEAKERGR